MLFTFGQHQWRAAVLDDPQNFITDHPDALLVGDQLVVEIMKLCALVRVGCDYGTKGSRANVDCMLKWPPLRRRLPIHSMPDWTALHEYDRMVSFFAGYRCRQAGYEFCRRPARDEFEALSGQMMAFINDQVNIITDAVLDDAFTNEALNYGDYSRSIISQPWLANQGVISDRWHPTARLQPHIKQV